MANLLESSATTQTTTPSFYTDYLSNIANKGTAAAAGAQFIGAQPLQQAAFEQVANKSTAYQPTLTAAEQTLGQAAATPSPLTAATPYFTAAGKSPAALAREYMDPYTQTVVNNLGDVGARNIRMNLAPQATSGAVGSGQFGSKRGAEVLGQTIGNANRDVLNAQYTALNDAYKNALTAATAQNQLQGTLGKAAGDLTVSGQQADTQTGTAQGNLAVANQDLALKDINALSTLGQQQQTIKQNEQNFPLTTLSTLSGLMAGQTIPTTQTQTASASPLSLLASGTTGLAGLVQPKYDAAGNPVANSSALANLGGLLGDVGSKVKGWYNDLTFSGNNPTGITTPESAMTGGNSPVYDSSGTYIGYNNSDGQFVEID